MLLCDKSIGPGYFRNQRDKSLSKILIDLNDIFQESHTSKQNSMAFFLQATGNFIQKLSNIVRNSFDNLDGGENGLLADVGRAIVTALNSL